MIKGKGKGPGFVGARKGGIGLPTEGGNDIGTGQAWLLSTPTAAQ